MYFKPPATEAERKEVMDRALDGMDGYENLGPGLYHKPTGQPANKHVEFDLRSGLRLLPKNRKIDEDRRRRRETLW